MPPLAPPLCVFPMWCSCCFLEAVGHGVVMVRESRGRRVGGRDGVVVVVVASRVSPCRRGLAHLKRAHGVVPGFRVVPAANRDFQAQGPGNAVRRHVAPASPLSRMLGGGGGRCGSVTRRQAALGRCNGWSACRACRRGATSAHRRRQEMLSANCDSRTRGDGQRNCQAANGASKKRATDRQQGTR